MGKIDLNAIKKYTTKIKEKFHPAKIILFGSYAYGAPTRDSDVDLLVITESAARPCERTVSIRKSLPAPFALDLIVRTPQEIKKKTASGGFFSKDYI